MEWFSTLSLALGSAWTSGINLYATVSVLGLLQKFGSVKLPGGLDGKAVGCVIPATRRIFLLSYQAFQATGTWFRLPVDRELYRAAASPRGKRSRA